MSKHTYAVPAVWWLTTMYYYALWPDHRERNGSSREKAAWGCESENRSLPPPSFLFPGLVHDHYSV